MGPSRSSAHLLAQRGRFQEGSMNDRVSAAPPMQFLDPSERAALERPVFWECQSGQMGPSAFMPSEAPTGGADDKRTSKMGILGQMWEGMRGKLRIRSHDEKERPSAREDTSKYREDRFNDTRARFMDKASQQGDSGIQRPSRDEVLANYQHLVASGFFSSRTIQSTRFAPPRPTTSHGPDGAAVTPPQWPLTPPPPVPTVNLNAIPMPQTPMQTRCPSQVYSPVSAASSRGTKRAAADSPPAVRNAADDIRGASHNHGGIDDIEDDEAEDDATLAHRFLPKRLRQTASRDISLPKIRSVASRKNLRSAVAAARRSLLMSAGAGAATQHVGSGGEGGDAAHDRVQQQTNRLSMKLGGSSYGQTSTSSGTDQDDARVASSVGASSPGRKIKRATSARGSKARGVEVNPAMVFGPALGTETAQTQMQMQTTGQAQPLSVVPDANRGIPSVPIIPAKFTYGEDRENGGPWRGLRWG
ncbi:hypothetical protein E4U19_003741 [Claviceps sp. Clav32 group G5]|nr:hypothetical protein E4U19_003741 [Claviceps sp. Clav32 group G5]KAG6049200.1 hypothetical protein E4U39_006391 [Claviceps sp. Clav50 group G5]